MGALVESELTNLNTADQDAAGYFGMRKSVWDQGEYAGFPTQPELQLKWFVHQSLAVNERRAANGQPPYGPDSAQWGQWAADVLLPAEQYRGRYQLRLDDARALLGPACGPQGMGPMPLRLDIGGGRTQHPLRRGRIVVMAACPLEACTASARGAVTAGNGARLYEIRSSARHLPQGGKARLTLRLGKRVRRVVRHGLRRHARLRALVTVSATGASGGSASAKRAISLRR
jgi:hypothetical protein